MPLHRGKTVWVSYLQCTFYAWFIYSFGATVAFIRETQGLTATQVSLLSVAFSGGGITAGFVTRPLIARFGRGRLLQAVSYTASLGMVLYMTAPTLAWTLVAVYLTSVSGALAIQCTAAYVGTHLGKQGPRAISEMHAWAAGVGLFGPICVGAGVAAGFGWQPGLVVAIAGLLGVEVARGRDASAYGPVPSATALDHHHDRPGALPKRFWWTWLCLVATTATEFSLLFWGATVLREQGGLGAAASAAALGCVVGGMFAGRTAVAFASSRVPAERLYLGSLILAAVGFLVFWRTDTAIAMMLGLAITGVGAGAHYPLGIERAMRASHGRSDRAAAMVSVGTGVAGGGAPFALGALSDVIGIHSAYGIVPVALGIAISAAVAGRVPPGD